MDDLHARRRALERARVVGHGRGMAMVGVTIWLIAMLLVYIAVGLAFQTFNPSQLLQEQLERAAPR